MNNDKTPMPATVAEQIVTSTLYDLSQQAATPNEVRQYCQAELDQAFSLLFNTSYTEFIALPQQKKLLSQLLQTQPLTKQPCKFISTIRVNKAEQLNKDTSIYYLLHASLYGQLVVASTDKGLCFLGFTDYGNTANIAQAETLLQQRFPKLAIEPAPIRSQQWQSLNHIAASFSRLTLADVEPTTLETATLKTTTLETTALHLIGSDFQTTVWQALLTIPYGQVVSYSTIANKVGKEKAVRAVATAIGQNPIAMLIPCHRVIQKNGELGGYHWGLMRKKLMLSLEQCQDINLPKR